MAFIDETKIKVKAGDGGDGVVRWLHTKETELGGPSGGDGGRGGDVYAKALRDVHLLLAIGQKRKLQLKTGKTDKQKTSLEPMEKILSSCFP